MHVFSSDRMRDGLVNMLALQSIPRRNFHVQIILSLDRGNHGLSHEYHEPTQATQRLCPVRVHDQSLTAQTREVRIRAY